jgi:zinc/manganese transport system substrate-binding protein
VRAILGFGAAVALLCGCASDSDAGGGTAGGPRVVVTSTIVGDLVEHVLGDQAEISVLLPRGADPHEFQPSARQVADMDAAALVVTSGGGFEQGMAGVLDNIAAGGVPVFALADHVELLPAGDGRDPHFWTDPIRTAAAVRAFGELAGTIEGIDGEAAAAAADAYAAELDDLDASIEEILAPVPAEDRVLVTDHEVFGYFAERYGFEVVGAVVPSISPDAQPSAADVTALAALIEQEGVPAIFSATTSSSQLAEALAGEVGHGVEVVDLFTESLGDPGSGADTYVGMLTTDAHRIADALETD